MPAIAASQILWGTNFDNVLSFDYPQGLDDTRTWRRPAPGSRDIRNPAGTSDAWINKFDYCLAGRARWFSRPAFGGLGLQDFIDWAVQKNTFRFVPDNRYPSFYVDNCVLDTPFDDPQPQLEQADGSQSIDIVIRQQAVDFSLVMRGLMFEYVPGKSLTDPAVATFVRGSVAYRIGRDSVLASAAANVLRDSHYENGVRTTLLEQSRVNGWDKSAQLDDAAYNKSGVTVTADAVNGPFGTMTAEKITEDSSNSWHFVSRNTPTLSDNATQAWTPWVRAGSRTWVLVTTIPKTGTRADSWVNLATGATATVSGEHTIRVVTATRSDGTVWRRISVIFGSHSGGSTPAVAIAPTTGDTVISYLGNGSGYIYSTGWQFEADQMCESSDMPTTSATFTRSDDTLSIPIVFTPQLCTIYLSINERGTILIGGSGATILGIGDGTTNSFVRVQSNGSSQYTGILNANGVQVASDLAVGGINVSDGLELRVVLYGDGSIRSWRSVNGGAESAAALTSAIGLPLAWSDLHVFLNYAGGASAKGLVALKCARIAFGERSLAEIRAM